jgi:hypothetical protein
MFCAFIFLFRGVVNKLISYLVWVNCSQQILTSQHLF